MDAVATVEKATKKEMAERIAELEHRESQLKNLNDDMRRWLEAGEEEIVGLRSENAALQKQVQIMEKLMSDAEQNEAELCRIRASLAEENNLKRHHEKEIQRLDNECSRLTEQNKKLITEMNRLNQQTEYDKTGLCNLKASLQNLQADLEEAKLGLQLRDNVILQQNLKLKHLQESTEESTDLIMDLRLRIQELNLQLEDIQDEALLARLTLTEREEKPSTSPLSFKEELKQLASSPMMGTNTSDCLNTMDTTREATEAEELEDRPTEAVDLPSQRCAASLQTGIPKARVLMLTFLVLIIVFSIACGGFAGMCFSTSTLWCSAQCLIQPYITLEYGALPFF